MTGMAIIAFSIVFYLVAFDFLACLKEYIHIKRQMAKIGYINRILGCLQTLGQEEVTLSQELATWAEEEIKKFLKEEQKATA